MRIALLIERPPAVLLRVHHDRVDPIGCASLECKVIHARAPTVMRRSREIRRRRQGEICATSSPRLALGPFALKSEAQLPQKPTPLDPRLLEIRDPHFDMMEARHPASLSAKAHRALGDTTWATGSRRRDTGAIRRRTELARRGIRSHRSRRCLPDFDVVLREQDEHRCGARGVSSRAPHSLCYIRGGGIS